MLRWLWDLIWFRPPTGHTLQERYPARPGVFTTSYSSVELPEEAFVAEPRGLESFTCPWCGHQPAALRALVKGRTIRVIECPAVTCQRVTRIEDLTDLWTLERL